MLVAEVAPWLPPLDANAARRVQALANLVDNALPYTPRGGRATVRPVLLPAPAEGDGAGRTLAFTVADTGTGIPAADLPHLFDATWHA